MYDFYLQIDLARVKGTSATTSINTNKKEGLLINHFDGSPDEIKLDSKPRKENLSNLQPFASIFFRFSHRDSHGVSLSVKQQRSFVS